ncbi:MAG: hypothetical protein ABSD98_13805 [Candidatus Korobacteraceae bacterium]|jgi:hypothetical protein
MRVYIAVFALCIIAAIMTTEPQNSATLRQNNSQAQAYGSVPTAETPEHDRKARDDSEKTGSNSPRWYTPLERPEWDAVIVAVGALLVIGWQSWETRKAAQATEKNTELYINRERARLRIDMKPLVLPAETDFTFNTVDFTVSVYGQTDAFITDSLCVAYIFPWELVNNPELGDRVMFPIHSLPSVVGANGHPVDCSVLLGPKGGPDNTRIDEAKARRMFVGMRGFIKYKDVFDRERETAFRYVWRYSEVVEDYGQWEKSGNPEENRET